MNSENQLNFLKFAVNDWKNKTKNPTNENSVKTSKCLGINLVGYM